MLSPLPRRVRRWLRSSTTASVAFPKARLGRLSHYAFRGLRSVHSRYGLRTRRIAFRSFTPKAPPGLLPPQTLRLLRARTTVARWDSDPLRTHDFHGAPSRERKRTGFSLTPVAYAPGSPPLARPPF